MFGGSNPSLKSLMILACLFIMQGKQRSLFVLVEAFFREDLGKFCVHQTPIGGREQVEYFFTQGLVEEGVVQVAIIVDKMDETRGFQFRDNAGYFLHRQFEHFF